MTPASRDHIRYLDHAAATDIGRAYKQQLVRALNPQPGQTILDVGCGPGTDLATLAATVGVTGSIIGIDHDPAMVEEARRRTASQPTIQVYAGNAHALPLPAHTVDRARLDRVLMHLADPGRALAELHRVLRPGGVLTLAEPDWDTLVIDDPDVPTSRAYTRFVATRAVRNGTIGRQLGRLAAEAGFTLLGGHATAIVFRDYAAAEQILRLRHVAERACQAGVLPAEPTRQWLDRLATGPFLAAFTFFTQTAAATSPAAAVSPRTPPP